jgi:hypothetical protein
MEDNMTQNKTPQCCQCSKEAIYDVQGHPFCLDCYEKYQKTQEADLKRLDALMNLVNYTSDAMEYTAGLRATPPKFQISQPIHATIKQSPVFNRFNIDNSVIGMLNTGHIQDMKNISINNPSCHL